MNATEVTEDITSGVYEGNFHLTEEEKLLIIIVCGSIVLLVTLGTVFVVTECCWLTPSSPKSCLNDGKDKLKITQGSNLISVPPLPYYTTGLNSFRDPCSRSTDNSINSKFDVIQNLDSFVFPEEDKNVIVDINYGQITFSLRFMTESKEQVGQLAILLKEAQDLPEKLYGGVCNPYTIIKLYLSRDRCVKIKDGTIPFCTFQSNVKRKTRHPLFMENYVTSLRKADLKKCIVKFLVYDHEKYANDTELGECTIYLKDYNLLKNIQIQEHTVDLTAPKETNGKLCFGLSYLPTAQRLTFTIFKACHLRLTTDDPTKFAPYVSVLMLKNGKVIQQRKTNSCQGSSFPVFNEVLSFDLPLSDLENVVLLTVVVDKGNGNRASSDNSNSKQIKKKSYVGKVALGTNTQGRGREQWNAMKQLPRKLLTYWHTLK
ncbi:synaptotagmin-C-like isoform X2 [Centruroides vittatus]|uniref:synaptotagmin-C-like isoform X2 n=1 Tax=Centruroides vittatus TaxID=120091 RepID=UPI00350EFF4E